MSVKAALNQEQFMGFVKFVSGRLATLEMTGTDFLKAVYGTTEAVPQSARDALRAMSRPRDATLEKWAPVLGVEVDKLKSLLDEGQAEFGRHQTFLKLQKKVPSVQAQVETASRALGYTDAPDVPPFSMRVNLDGSASLQVHIERVSIDTASQVLGVLRAADLWKS